MAINVDTSKPLSDEVIEDLRSRLPENLVQHYIDQANATKDEPKKSAAKPAAKKDDASGDILT
jgi:hypothetical protein